MMRVKGLPSLDNTFIQREVPVDEEVKVVKQTRVYHSKHIINKTDCGHSKGPEIHWKGHWHRAKRFL